jgi:hypothetical protein
MAPLTTHAVKQYRGAVDRVQLAGPRVAADVDRNHCIAALEGPLTVIQGPPGTGRAEGLLIDLQGTSIECPESKSETLGGAEMGM